MNYFRLDHEEIASKEELIEVLERLFSKAWNELIDDGLFYSCYALTFLRMIRSKKKFKELHYMLRARLADLFYHCKRKKVISKATNSKGKQSYSLSYWKEHTIILL